MKKTLKIVFIAILLVIFLLIVISIAFFIALKPSGSEPFDTTFYQLQSDKVTDNIRIVFMSDLHAKEYGADNTILLEKISALKPDIIIIGGDMTMYGDDDYRPTLFLCQQLVEIAPLYYGLGNHEFQEMIIRDSKIHEDIAETGAIVLHDCFVTTEIKKNTVKIGGLTESGGAVVKYSGDFLPNYSEEDGFKILISHYPQNFFSYLYDYDFDLVLSGHEHGGGIIIPYIHEPYTDGKRIEYKNEKDTSTLIVSRGLGDSSEIPRLNNKYELVVIDINWY